MVLMAKGSKSGSVKYKGTCLDSWKKKKEAKRHFPKQKKVKKEKGIEILDPIVDYEELYENKKFKHPWRDGEI